MDATNWQRPVDADGKLDLRLEDRWTVKKGPPPAGIVKSLPCGACGEIAMLTEKHGLQVTTMHELGALISRRGIAWDVPADKRAGRWVASVTLGADEMNRAYFDDPTDRMVWLPDAVAPEPVRMDAPEPGKHWENGGLVYRPIHDGDGILRYKMPNGASLFLHSANGATDFVGYYFGDRGIRNVSALYVETTKRGQRQTTNRWKPGVDVERPSHVVFKQGGE